MHIISNLLSTVWWEEEGKGAGEQWVTWAGRDAIGTMNIQGVPKVTEGSHN